MTCRHHPARQPPRRERLTKPKAQFHAPLGEAQHPAYAAGTCPVCTRAAGRAWERLPTQTCRYAWLGAGRAPRRCPGQPFLLQIPTFNSSPLRIKTPCRVIRGAGDKSPQYEQQGTAPWKNIPLP